MSCSSRSGRRTTREGCRSASSPGVSACTDETCARRSRPRCRLHESRRRRGLPGARAVEADHRHLARGGQEGAEEAAPHRPARLAAPRRGARAPRSASPRCGATSADVHGPPGARPGRGDRSPAPPARRGGRGRLRHGQLLTWAARVTGCSMFVMRLSASGRGFHRVYLNEAQEVFLDGHVRAFEHFGGVPGRIRYDNLKAAVAQVLKAGTDRVRALRRLRSHYGFDSFFCLPGHRGRPRERRRRRRGRALPPPPPRAGARGSAPWPS